MPWFRNPLTWRLRQPDLSGPIRIRANVELEIRLPSGRWFPVRNCLLDTGASFTIFSTAWARAAGIPIPQPISTMPLLTAAGNRNARVRDADLHVRFRLLREFPFNLAAVFSDDYSPTAPPLLGLHNLLNSWRFTFDGTPNPAAIMGHMWFETL